MAQSGQLPQAAGRGPQAASPPSSLTDTKSAAATAAPSAPPGGRGLFRRLLGRVNGGDSGTGDAPGQQDGGAVAKPASEPRPEPRPEADAEADAEADEVESSGDKNDGPLDPDDPRLAPPRRVHRQVVPGLPRTLTFKRQMSELRDNLMPADLTPAERRAVSADRRLQSPLQNVSESQSNPRTSAPDVSAPVGIDAAGAGAGAGVDASAVAGVPSASDSRPGAPCSPTTSLAEKMLDMGPGRPADVDETTADEYPPPFIQTADSLPPRSLDTLSMTTSQFDRVIHEDLEKKWILNLSMHFRDKSKREKFFVTYRQHEHLWRRVTISLDYRASPEGSLEQELEHTRFQRDKNAKIYEAIRESLQDIQFYETVTNLKLQTTDGRLHVHVVEDVNEIIHYPAARMIKHLRCRRVREREIEFDSHMSGFVYKVRVHGATLIKKEIPGPDTIDEFLYEVNALAQLQGSRNVIGLYGVIVDDREEHVKGLLISFAENGALVDMIFDHDHGLPWARRERWARQIVEGLSEIHEAGFVQGDFTLSNIVIDEDDNAKIIDINRRGCPVGWEPPEATPLIEGGQRISMYIGVKSDLYQLGMVLWALATQEDEPEAHSRPLRIEPGADCPPWFHTVVDTCLAEDPRLRAQAVYLLGMFPGSGGQNNPGPGLANGGGVGGDHARAYSRSYSRHAPSMSVDSSAFGPPIIKTVNSPPPDWSYKGYDPSYVDAAAPPPEMAHDPYKYYPRMRGRSPPSPMHSNPGGGEPYRRFPPWSAAYSYDQSLASTSSLSEVGGVLVGPRRRSSSARDGRGGMLEVDHHPDERSITPRTNTGSAAGRRAPAPLDYTVLDVSALDETPRADETRVMFGGAGNLGYEKSPALVSVEVRPETIPLPRSPLAGDQIAESQGAVAGAGTSPVYGASGPDPGFGNRYMQSRDLDAHFDDSRGQLGTTAPEAQIASIVMRNNNNSIPLLLRASSHLTVVERLSTGAADSHRAESGSNRDSKTAAAGGPLSTATAQRLSSSDGDNDYETRHRRDVRHQQTHPYALRHKEDQEDGGAALLPPGLADSSTPRRLPSHSSGSARASPVPAELPDDLKGIGAAYDQLDDEAMRTQTSIIDEDDLRLETSAAAAAASELGDRPVPAPTKHTRVPTNG